jgi:hypothetical protein
LPRAVIIDRVVVLAAAEQPEDRAVTVLDDLEAACGVNK